MAVSISISIAQNSQSVANNKSNVTVTLKASWTSGSYNTLQKSGWLKINGTTYSFTSSFNTGRTTTGSQTLFSKNVNIAHNANGTKTLSCSASFTTGVSSGTVTASASKTLTTIPRASSWNKAVNGILGAAQTLTITRQSSTFKHKLIWACGNKSGYIAGSSTTFTTATSFTWTPSESLAAQNTTGTSVSIKLTLKTYDSSGNGIGTVSKTISCKILGKPSCAVSVTDAAGYKNTYGSFIKGKSKYKVVVTATKYQGSPISSYRTSANDATYTTASFTTGVVKTSGIIMATVTDGRGQTGSATFAPSVLDYSDPVIRKLAVKRCNADGTENDQGSYVQVTFSATVTSLNSKNTPTYKIGYKKSTAAAYTEKTSSDSSSTLNQYHGLYSVTDGTFIFEADSGSSYNVEFTISDGLSSVSRTTSASTGFTLMHWLASGTGMAIGKVAEAENVFDVGLNSYFRQDVCIGNRTAHLDGKTGVYIDAEGFMHLQRDTGQGYYPYIGFSLDSATAVGAQIEYDGGMNFSGATEYNFDADVHLTNGKLLFDSYGKNVRYATNFGTAYMGTSSAGDILVLRAKKNADSSYFSSVILVDSSGVNLVPKTGGAFTGNISTSGTFSATGDITSSGNITASGAIAATGSLRTDGRIYSKGTYDTTGTAAANMIISSAYWTYRSSSSSRRYKHDIYELSDSLNSEKLLNVPVKQYIYNLDYISEEDQRYNTPIPGFIAEDMYEHYPIAVEIKDGMIEDWNHRMIIPPMLDLIQKLWTKVEKLEENTA